MLRFFLCIIVASYADSLPSSDTDGSINLYNDAICSTLFETSDPVSIEYCLGVDANTVLGASVASFPTCSSGTPYLAITDTRGCEQGSFWPPPKATASYECLYLFDGLFIASLAFACTLPDPDGESYACPVVNITTPGTCISSIAAPSTYTVLPTSTPTSLPSSSPTTTSEHTSSDKIALGIGLGVGLPALLLAIWGSIWQCLLQRRR